ncbi:MAG: hypothetical protein J6V30_02045 [Paludibacteraceae bacterium]|nr:hypothetical protein [Paludibacteraceae bacterium]
MKKLFLLSLASLFAIGASAISSFTGKYNAENMMVAVWKPNEQPEAKYPTMVNILHEDGASSCAMSIKDFSFAGLNIGDIEVDGISVSEDGNLTCTGTKEGPYVESITSKTYIQINSGTLYEDEEDGYKKKLDIQLTVYTSEETVDANKVAQVVIVGAEFVETSVEDYSGVYSSENNTTITFMGTPTTVTAPIVVDQEDMSCSISVSGIVVAGQTIDLEFSNLELTDDAGSYSIPTSSVETTIGEQSFTITIVEEGDNYFEINGGKKYLYLELSAKSSGIEMGTISIVSELTSAASAQNAVSSAPVVSVKYYGINGQLFGENPVKNVMNIKVETKADGSVSSSKYIQY